MNDSHPSWTVQQRAALVLDLLAGRTQLAAAAQQTGLSPATLQTWVDAAQQGLETALRDQTEVESAQEAQGDLRDLIRRPFADHDTVTVDPERSLSDAWQLMRREGISQLPVMDGERIVGILDESDVLLHVYGDEARFADPARAAMVQRLDKVAVHAPIEALLPVFDRGHVAIVMDGEAFLGLITRIDLLDYLRRRVG